eukprot:gene32755-40428_t
MFGKHSDSKPKNFPNRRKLPNKSVTILHLKRFACHYDPAAEGNQFSGNDDGRELTYEFFCEFMKANNITSIPASDLAKILGIPMRSMQYIRVQAVAYQKAGGLGKVRFFEAICQPTLLGSGGLSCAKLAWCVGITQQKVKPPNNIQDNSNYQMSRNLPLYEHVNACLRNSPNGLGTSDIRHLAAISNKVAYKDSNVMSSSSSNVVDLNNNNIYNNNNSTQGTQDTADGDNDNETATTGGGAMEVNDEEKTPVLDFPASRNPSNNNTIMRPSVAGVKQMSNRRGTPVAAGTANNTASVKKTGASSSSAVKAKKTHTKATTTTKRKKQDLTSDSEASSASEESEVSDDSEQNEDDDDEGKKPKKGVTPHRKRPAYKVPRSPKAAVVHVPTVVGRVISRQQFHGDEVPQVEVDLLTDEPDEVSVANAVGLKPKSIAEEDI